MLRDPGTKIRLDRGDIAPRINNVGHLVGFRVRQVSWLDTYHRRTTINATQHAAGEEFASVCRVVATKRGYALLRLDRVPGGLLNREAMWEASQEFKDSLAAIRNPECRGAALDLCLFDLAMGPRRLPSLRHALDDLAAFFKVPSYFSCAYRDDRSLYA